ncbi:hypothetical protein Rsub_04112 [Raphidocelis subcapitata]|uniref:Glycolipid transfer protein domain-containing protein n=1 Tax=Raphidocelis subcapitata TaxID=307507 RepID=A0A2V0NXH2_9CHLO|nr:hypothetical protein Rsub_04112 [Raphidocelis subcapitata]|eukprot:GBF91372.1 hypothetical protein Rsub_04112 [Raphidocelis subcapitata]
MAAAAATLPAEAAPTAAVEALAQRSLFRAALDAGANVKDADGNIITDGFLDLCQLVLPLIDSFGAAFGIVRNDISGNIERLRARKASDPARFRLLYPIVEEEVARNDVGGSSCTKGLLWLKRAMEFMVSILRCLQERPSASMSEVVYEQWHGWLATSAFSVAFAFVPGRATFLDRLAGGKFNEQTAADMAQFVSQFGGLLAEVHQFLDERGQDDPYKV